MKMAVTKVEINTYFGQCKCCHNYAYLKNMWEQHCIEGRREIYGKMLVDCFCISWTIKDTIEDDKICEECIIKLRDAFSFKKMVIQSQEKFEEIQDKEEVIEDADDNLKNDSASEGSAEDEKDFEEVEFLEEELLDVDDQEDESQDSQPATRKRKWRKTLPKSEQNKTYKQYSEEDLKTAVEAVRSKVLTPAAAALKYRVPSKTLRFKAKFGEDDGDGANRHGIHDENEDPDRKEVILSKHRANIRSILVATNATPIKGHWGIGYACSFCPQQFTAPKDLKLHTIEHGNQFASYKIRSLEDHIVKLDITDLKCNKCGQNLDSLENLMVHLKDVHKMPIHFDIQNHIVPFDFGNETLQCVMCFKPFDEFKHLSEHMNDEHCRNYECHMCHRGFVNIRSLKTHSIRHRIFGIFACSYCPQIFDTKLNLIEHENHDHDSGVQCSYCDKKFKDTLLRTKHENDVHMVPKAEHKCSACSKLFESRQSLVTHVNEVHLLYKPHKCSECNDSFYLKSELKKHLNVHLECRRSLKCPDCPRRYSTRGALRKHALQHSDERKHACEICGDQFQKEVNYLAHVRNKHGLE